jgi:serine/threonine protein kinase
LLVASLIVVVSAVVFRHYCWARQKKTKLALSFARSLSRLFMPGCIPWCEDNENEFTTSSSGTNGANPTRHPLLQHTTISAEASREIETEVPVLLSASPSTSTSTVTVSKTQSWFDHIYWKSPKTLLEDILTMGNCLTGGPGSAPIIETPDGNEEDFHSRYIEDRVLGEGEFGVVKLVHDMREPDEAKNTMACKVLRKGVVFKDNTIYAPLKPEILKSEVEILRTLNGEHYCMALKSVYETSRAIFVVTEYCAGGEMMEYVAKQEEDLRTDDVSRVAFQMLDAVNHCAQNNIIHRDIKPENVMFQFPSPGSDLRLIDFGSGTNKVVEGLHTTFAGSAFYISPEMFQRTYSLKTDVWSVGVTLYVLVAGYPADVLQKAFNRLQSTNRKLQELPNLPDNMPNSFYDMLEGLLQYRHKKRKSAGEMLTHEFVQFHKSAFSVEQIAMQAQTDDEQASDLPGLSKPIALGRTTSVSLRGSVGRHSQFLDYQKYQRSLTTLLATLLNKKELAELFTAITKSFSKDEKGETKKEEPEKTAPGAPKLPEFGQRLDVIKMRNLKTVLKIKSTSSCKFH